MDRPRYTYGARFFRTLAKFGVIDSFKISPRVVTIYALATITRNLMLLPLLLVVGLGCRGPATGLAFDGGQV